MTDLAAQKSSSTGSSVAKALKHVFLVDGSGYIFRAYHALPPMTRTDGTPVNAVYGYTNMLMKLIEDTDADHIAVIFDAKRVNFRNEIYADYKANRDDPPEDLVPQFELIREATKAFNVACIEKEGYEADDLIATYARQAESVGADVTIVSSDKDLMQLVSDKITMLDPIKNKPLGRDQVLEKFGVPPEKVIDVQALAGDSIDNIPGVPGIGVKTAAQLLQEFGDLETLLEKADTIKQPKRRQVLIDHAEDARLSKRLVRLEDQVTDIPPLETMAVQEIDVDKAISFLTQNDFRTTLTRFKSRHGKDADASGDEELASPPTQAEYELITTEKQLDQWIEQIEEASRVTVDTETDSLDARAANLVGISLSVHKGTGCYIPLNHKPDGTVQGELGVETKTIVKQLPLDLVVKKLGPVLEHPGILKIAQNAKYDFGVLSRYGIRLSPLEDTMLLSYALSAGKGGHGMDDLARNYLDIETIKFKDVVGSGKNQKTFDQIDPQDALNYAAEDADITGRLYTLLKRDVYADKVATVYETIDRPLVPIIADMEQAGIKVDPAFLNQLSKDFDKRLGEISETVFKISGREFNIGSPKQLGEVLFEEMCIEGGKKTKTGAYQTGGDILEKLAANGQDIATHVLEWRQLSKLKSTYTDALIQQINPETGRVHTSFSLAVTSTGRLSSSDPNLQNIPIRTEEGRKIRQAFVAEKGHKLISVDYSQIELRLMAEIAQVEKLKNAFIKGEDIHALTAHQVFGVPIEGMDPMVRRNAKAINFGIIYGISPFGLGRQLDIPTGEAKKFIDAYFDRFPEILEFMEKTKQFAHEHGYVTSLFGRKCHVPGINDKNPALRGFSERAAINAPLQGTAADIIKRAMIRLPDALKQAGLATRLLLQVHDELILEAPENEAEKALQVTKEVMQMAHKPALDFVVPIVCEGAIGDTWGEAH